MILFWIDFYLKDNKPIIRIFTKNELIYVHNCIPYRWVPGGDEYRTEFYGFNAKAKYQKQEIEAGKNFIQQFMIDYCLFGMSEIRFRRHSHRGTSCERNDCLGPKYEKAAYIEEIDIDVSEIIVEESMRSQDLIDDDIDVSNIEIDFKNYQDMTSKELLKLKAPEEKTCNVLNKRQRKSKIRQRNTAPKPKLQTKGRWHLDKWFEDQIPILKTTPPCSFQNELQKSIQMYSPVEKMERQWSFYHSPPTIDPSTKRLYKFNPPPLLTTLNSEEIVQNSIIQKYVRFKKHKLFTFAVPPPTYLSVQKIKKQKRVLTSQIDRPTPINQYGFQYPSQSTPSKSQANLELSILSLEVFVGSEHPDPKKDEILSIFYCFKSNSGCSSGSFTQKNGLVERQLFKNLIELVRRLNPHILTSFETEKAGIGYLCKRAWMYDVDLVMYLGQMKVSPQVREKPSMVDEYNTRKGSGINVIGRVVINLWRVLRKTVALFSYTFESFVFHVLHKRIPLFSAETLKEWYDSNDVKLLKYWNTRVEGNIELLDKTGTISQTIEFSKLGLDFRSVLLRGSQFKVEAVLFRLLRKHSFIPFYPSKDEVRSQRAPECIALNMEPKSGLYDTILVLDFASLYPSMMISHNICYSTCVGRIGSSQLGCKNYDLKKEELDSLKDHIKIINGIGFVDKTIRKSILAEMLTSLLQKRKEVKKLMKETKDEGKLKILDAKQNSLKLLANTTFGYTAASFSGRMPCVEIADAIVQAGRLTLEETIEFINGHEGWGQVVYGDTDSVFVHLKNCTKEKAFEIGREIAKQVSARYPDPVELKFEKVYKPALLVAKKRYCGMKYESEHDPGKFEAKGIETVRRDSCPAVGAILESSLKVLFQNNNIEEVKDYLYDQWHKILAGEVSLNDFFISREVKLGTYRSTTLPPAAHLATKKMEEDPNAETLYGERLPFVVAAGTRLNRLIDNVVTPEEFLINRMVLNTDYYITKQIIPPLQRTIGLVGVDVLKWFEDMPRSIRAIDYIEGDKRTIDHYYKALRCEVCRNFSNSKICKACSNRKVASLLTLNYRMREVELRHKNIHRICGSCSGQDDGVGRCISMDCPVFFARMKNSKQMLLRSNIQSAIDLLEL